MALTQSELVTLENAYAKLENPSLAIRLSSAVGMPVEAVTRELGKRAPDVIVEAVSKSTHRAIELVLQNSMRSIRGDARKACQSASAHRCCHDDRAPLPDSSASRR